MLADASKILSAWARVCCLVNCTVTEEDLISKTSGSEVTAAAVEHLSFLIPAVHGDS